MTAGMVLRWRMAAVVGAMAIALGVFASAAAARPSQNIPGPPATVFGSINDAAGPVAAGVSVEGLIDGKVCSKDGKTVRTGEGKAQITAYAIDVASDSQTPGCGKAGSVVTIKIGDRTASQTAKWDAGPVRLDVTFGDVTPVPIPTFTPTTTGTPKPTVAIGTQTPHPSVASSAVPTLKGGVTGSPVATAASDSGGGGFPIWAIVLIVVVALAVIGGGVGFVMARNRGAGTDGDGDN